MAQRVFVCAVLCTILGLSTPTSGRAATCDAYCTCGSDESFACSSDCESGWSALCTDGNCGGYNAGCCCQQGLIGGGLNYICSSKKCGIRFTIPFLVAEDPPVAVDNTKAQHGHPRESPREEWAYLEYTVGADLAVTVTKAHHASSRAFADTLIREMVEGRHHSAPAPGTYRSFELRAPQDRSGFGDSRRVSRALKALREPLAAIGVEEGQFALRVELNAGGTLVSRQEIFSTLPGLSEHLHASLDKFLAQSGLDKAGRPLVIFLVFHIEQGNVVSASTTNYLAA